MCLRNCHPVLNLGFVSKVLERLVCESLEAHLCTRCLHDVHQSAYRRFHSTETALLKVQTALLKVQTDILDALDKGSLVMPIMADNFHTEIYLCI